MIKNPNIFVLAAMLCFPLSGCSKTVGQQFRDILADIDAECRAEKLGPYLDKSDPEYRDKSAQTQCDILTIKPADPLATEEGRFAYSLKLPAPHDKLKAEYSKGMSAESYFKELCEKDAGEWVFRTVGGVEGIFQGRRNIPPSRGSSLVVQAYETTEIITQDMQDVLVQPYHGRYDFLERPVDTGESGKMYVRYFRGAEIPGHYKIGTQKGGQSVYVPYIVNKEPTNTLKSRYGFTWRQISTADMLENGIEGGETIIFDRATNEVLAYRRFFYRQWPRADSRYTHLTDSAGCHPGSPGVASQFIQRVLVPINPAE